MGVNFIAILLRTMEDPDVITSAQVCARNSRVAEFPAAREKGGTIVEEVRTLGFICTVVVMRNTHTLQSYSGARYYTEFSGPSPTWENMQKTCPAVIRVISSSYYVPMSGV